MGSCLRLANCHALNDAAQYVGDRLREYGLKVSEQSDLSGGRTVVNLEGVLRGAGAVADLIRK
ncbi:hypothetical protein KOM00_02090 [Geomonas sp. Red69]|uniref:Uncharacterized protein n=1 Tax=Geomonas diazotrophica TaxID=2843197 RepID=A0ABX8JHG1_9BACT|nr:MULTISPECIES: hypothetical protein [Geomonas]MBU5635517.1 hypothetical protein [Geomonas diazotrophica]QWV97431.1 hypothetical protein KP005_19155 [Geomonas nitrogeniifigens]QXE86589.1 hypothetical protein KP003_19895 [Geomonas nitrogeniifigens]